MTEVPGRAGAGPAEALRLHLGGQAISVLVQQGRVEHHVRPDLVGVARFESLLDAALIAILQCLVPGDVVDGAFPTEIEIGLRGWERNRRNCATVTSLVSTAIVRSIRSQSERLLMMVAEWFAARRAHQ